MPTGTHSGVSTVHGGADAHLRPRAQYGADLNARTAKDWTPLSYAKAKGKYGVTHEKGIYPEDVLKARARHSCAALHSAAS